MYEEIKQEIDAKITTNGVGDITGKKLNETLHSMVGGMEKAITVLPQSLSNGEQKQAQANLNDTTASQDGKMGYKVLQPQTEDPTTTFAAQIADKPNTIFEIRDVFDLDDDEVEIPDNCKFKFNGGVIKNGVLSGELHSDDPIDISSFGVVYDSQDSTVKAANGDALSVLGGITNSVKLKMTGDVYAINSEAVELVNLCLDGQGNTLYIDTGNYHGFKVCGDVDIKNLNIISTEWSGVGHTLLTYEADKVTKPVKLSIKDCYFYGNLRVLTAYQVASSSLDKCFSSIEVENNVFENNFCSIGSNVIFYLTDTNFESLSIVGNSIHNFYSMFFNIGLTNSTDYDSTYIPDFYSAKSRSYIIKDNVVVNDLDFKPWENESASGSYVYICFVLAEQGDCLYENNKVVNLIGDGVQSVYDSYLSVTNLDYIGNYAKNVYNLSDSNNHNQVLKSKSGRGRRLYRNNTFITEDLSETFDNVNFDTLRYALVSFEGSSIESLVIDNNVFNICSLSVLMAITSITTPLLVIKDNTFDIGCVVTNGIGDCLFRNFSENATNIVTNNRLSITKNKPYASGTTPYVPNLFNIEDATKQVCRVSGNYAKNAKVYSIISSTNKTGDVCNNQSLIEQTEYFTIPAAQHLVGSSCDDNLLFENNSISVNSLTTTPKLFYSSAVDLMNKFESELYFQKAEGSSGVVQLISSLPIVSSNKKYVIDVYSQGKAEHLLHSEFNIKPNGDNAVAYTAFKDDSSYDASITSAFNLKNFCNSGMKLNVSSRVVTFTGVNIPYGVPIVVSMQSYDISDDKLITILDKGATTYRPTAALGSSDSGFKFYDTILGRDIYWNGTTWVDTAPQIEGVSLVGNKTAADLGLATATQLNGVSAEVSELSIQTSGFDSADNSLLALIQPLIAASTSLIYADDNNMWRIFNNYTANDSTSASAFVTKFPDARKIISLGTWTNKTSINNSYFGAASPGNGCDIKTLSLTIPSLITDLRCAFSYLGKLVYATLGGGSDVENMRGVFKGCTLLKQVSFTQCSTGNLSSLRESLYNCTNLEYVSFQNCDFSKLTTTEGMFAYAMRGNKNCIVDFSECDFSTVSNTANMFTQCLKLSTLRCGKAGTLKQNITFSQSSLLTADSVASIIAWLYDFVTNTPSVYDSTSAYNIGDVVTQDSKTYICSNAIGSGGETWDSSHWAETGKTLTLKKDAINRYNEGKTTGVDDCSTLVSAKGWTLTQVN